MNKAAVSPTTCQHCGDECTQVVYQEEQPFCCQGCATVYDILHSNGLEKYYDIEQTPGISRSKASHQDFNYLTDAATEEKLVDYRDEQLSIITVALPQIHCSSCIWILENLGRLHEGVLNVRVNFLKKEAQVSYNHVLITTQKLFLLLAKIGYEPTISLASTQKKKEKPKNKRLLFQLGVAGFSFGNIMMMTLPEYFNTTSFQASEFRSFFAILCIFLSLPVLLYSGIDYFKSATKSIHQKRLNIDVPIAMGMLVIFFTSIVQIVQQTGIGYLDSLSGLVFFLLLGKWFQAKSFHLISFDRDYQSYFPIAVARKENDSYTSVPLDQLQQGDIIQLKNSEVIPTDAKLLTDKTSVDFSFVTGESTPVTKNKGDLIYAGGRVIGKSITLEVEKEVSQSYLTNLWNNDVFLKPKTYLLSHFVDRISQHFTLIIFMIALLAGSFWFFFDTNKLLYAFSSVLIIACPCALALSLPLTFGNAMRVLSKKNFYLKNIHVIDALSRIDTVVFDKTGTLTNGESSSINYHGNTLTEEQTTLLKSTLKQSTHPLGQAIFPTLVGDDIITPESFLEDAGRGLTARFDTHVVSVGLADYLSLPIEKDDTALKIHVLFDQVAIGYFTFSNEYRDEIQHLNEALSSHYNIAVLTGDNERERKNLTQLFPAADLQFNQSPHDKLAYLEQLNKEGKHVLMIGDGLNDAGALQQADVGLAVTENTMGFSPASDVIMSVKELHQLDHFLAYIKRTKKVVIINFIVSFLYNLIGLSFAVSGQLSPLIASILMPVSSVTVLLIALLGTKKMM